MVKLSPQEIEERASSAIEAPAELNKTREEVVKAAKGKRAQSRKAGRKSRAGDQRRPGRKPYPVMTFEEALRIANGLMEHGQGHPMKRTTLLAALGMGDSQPTRNLITTSGKYGITLGSYQSEELSLTENGRLVVDPKSTGRKKAQACFDLAIAGVSSFKKLYDKFKGGNKPATEVMRDALDDLDEGDRPQCVDIFIANSKYIGLLQTRSGAAYLLTIDQLLEELPSRQGTSSPVNRVSESDQPSQSVGGESKGVSFDRVCFFIAPIDEEGSVERQHSDAVLASFVEPLLKEHGLTIVRADQITKPGMITGQVIEYIAKSKLVVADLSFHDPNVFYEVCLRHVTGKPTVHLIREGEEIPFDLKDFRTIFLPVREVYSMLAKFDTSKAEIAQQIRQVLADGATVNNPILAYFPSAKFVLDGAAVSA